MFNSLVLIGFLFSSLPAEDKLLNESTYCAICKEHGRELAGKILIVMDYDVDTYNAIINRYRKLLIIDIIKSLEKNDNEFLNKNYKTKKLNNEIIAENIVKDIESGKLSYDDVKKINERYFEVAKMVREYKFYYNDFKFFLNDILEKSDNTNGVCAICFKRKEDASKDS